MASSKSADESVSLVKSVCGCSSDRAAELLEAGGSVDRAVDIYFSQQQSLTSHANDESLPPAPKRVKTSPSPSKQQEQARVSSFFSPRPKSSPGSENQTREESVTPLVSSKRDCLTYPIVAALPTEKNATTSNTVDGNKSLQYFRLAEAFTSMVDTTKRLAKLDTLKQALGDIIDSLGGVFGDETCRQGDAKVLQYALELIVGTTFTLQVSGSAVSKAIEEVTGASSSQIRSSYRQLGDLGDVSDRLVRNQRLLIKPKPLTIVGVYETLQQISRQRGKGSQAIRHSLMVKLLRSCRGCEIRFLVRTLLGNMRLGANMKTILAALAMAFARNGQITNDDAVQRVQYTFDYCPRLDKMALALLVGSIHHMELTCTLTVGTCINPMLANPAHSLEEVEKMMATGGPAVAEWKYDGVRCQAHYSGTSVILFSRHMLEQTAQFPDVVEFLQQAKGPQVESFILDSEIVGYERGEEGEFRLLPFQDLSTRRGNKTDSERIPIRVFAFDLMFLNGKSLVKRPLAERQLLLRENFNIVDGFAFAQSLSLPGFDLTSIMNFLQNAVAGGAEGLMVKLTGERMDYAELNEDTKRTVANDKGVAVCQYESGVRSHTWLKVKRDYVAGFADTIDVVPIGAWYGNGRKAQKGFLSPVLLAVYDEEEDVFRSICRCMSFTDAMYGAMRDFYLRGIPYAEGIGVESDVSPAERTNLKESDVNGENSGNEAVPDDIASDDQDDDASERINCYPSRPSALVVTNESPTIWFKPCEVFEVSFADLTLSRQHSAAAGLVDPIRGVALRFPRFKRRRPDKRIDQATTTVEIARLFEKQAKVQNPKK